MFISRLGLETISQLTNQRRMKVRIEVTDWDGTVRYAEYSTFRVGDAASKYTLTLSGYGGTLGSSIYNNAMRFSTKDQDNDEYDGNCATQYHGGGGWWYNACTFINLNGAYKEYMERLNTAAGLLWQGWKSDYSFKRTVMMIDRT